MASLLRFVINPVELQDMIKVRHDLAESLRLLHFIAARKIQAWFRGIITRNHFRKLHKSATILQRYWRGYCARIFVHQYLAECVHQMWQDYYNSMATRIQAIWRGYWTRKTQINVLQLRQWRRNLHMKNNETLENMRKFRQKELDHAGNVTEREAMHWILFILFKLHHLLGTKCRPGVITKIDKTRFTYIEEMLKCLEYNRYVSRAKSACGCCQIDRKRSFMLRGTYFKRCEKELREFEKSLSVGNVSTFTDQSFDENNQYIIKNERLVRQRCKQSERDLHQNLVHMQPNKLYEAVNKMNCQLERFRLNCPIHNSIF